MRKEFPHLLCLGAYNPAEKTGPAIWLRCAIAGKIPELQAAADSTFILYLPGVSRQDLRAVESCPEELKPLAELQFRSAIWSQYNGRDWTLLSYLVSDKGGLGLDVATDTETKQALQNALIPLLNENLANLEGKRLDRDYFNSLLTGGDPVRDMLNWLNLGDEYKESLSAEEWQAFSGNTKSRYGINPDKDGLLSAVKALVDCDSANPKRAAWQQSWERFCDTPQKFPNIPNLIRKLPVPDDWLYLQNLDGSFDRYPQWNEERERILKQALHGIEKLPETKARAKIKELEKEHGRRRDLIWAELGEAKYAVMLKNLVQIAELSEQCLDTGSLSELEKLYSEELWQIDSHVIELLAQTHSNEDLSLISGILSVLYYPWLERSARYLQKAGLLVKDFIQAPDLDTEAVLFIDGLRFDCAKKLSRMLVYSSFQIEESPRWTGLPSITATCKPILLKALFSKANHFEGAANFEALSSYEFKRLLEQQHWQVLSSKDAIPVPQKDAGVLVKRLWVELGNLDELGHSQGWKLSKHIDGTLSEIVNAVKSIFAAGWQSLKVISDHGWLLSSVGLPKSELSHLLSESKWHRFAILKEGASTQEHVYPWFWDAFWQIAIADGISCYRSGVEYTHGGLSIQECLLLDIKLRKPASKMLLSPITITDIKWVGLRCTIAIQGQIEGLRFDIRRSPADDTSSVALNVKAIKSDYTASVVVEDDSLIQTKAYIVILDTDGNIVSQIQTTIGGGTDENIG